MSGKITLSVLLLALLLMVTIPYLAGFNASGGEYQFGGFLINPVDGNSYLAKMQLGYQGEWKFRLPYTADPGEGAYLFLFYIVLGHIARLMGLNLIYVFHGARLIGAIWLTLMIYRCLRATFQKNDFFQGSFALAIFGSGLGWLAVLFGLFTSDFWVAEAFPYLSMYTNPHFSVGLGLMIYSLSPGSEGNLPGNLVSAAALALIQPFGIVIVCLVKIIQRAVGLIRREFTFQTVFKQAWFWPLVYYGLTGGLIILYQFAAILSDPVLSQWHLQNITARPEPWDLAISLLPGLALGLMGIREAWRSDTGRVLLIWAAVCLVLVFIPWSLQRRFLTGIYFPLAALSIFGLQALKERTGFPFRRGIALLLFLAIPTNLVILVSGFQAVSERNQAVFLDIGLTDGLDWIKTHTAPDQVVLTDSAAGLYVPAWTGRRVVYGHPFETIQAAETLHFLDELFLVGQNDSYYEQVLNEGGYELVLIQREGANSFGEWLEKNWQLLYSSGEHQIFQEK